MSSNIGKAGKDSGAGFNYQLYVFLILLLDINNLNYGLWEDVDDFVLVLNDGEIVIYQSKINQSSFPFSVVEQYVAGIVRKIESKERPLEDNSLSKKFLFIGSKVSSILGASLQFKEDWREIKIVNLNPISIKKFKNEVNKINLENQLIQHNIQLGGQRIPINSPIEALKLIESLEVVKNFKKDIALSVSIDNPLLALDKYLNPQSSSLPIKRNYLLNYLMTSCNLADGKFIKLDNLVYELDRKLKNHDFNSNNLFHDFILKVCEKKEIKKLDRSLLEKGKNIFVTQNEFILEYDEQSNNLIFDLFSEIMSEKKKIIEEKGYFPPESVENFLMSKYKNLEIQNISIEELIVVYIGSIN